MIYNFMKHCTLIGSQEPLKLSRTLSPLITPKALSRFFFSPLGLTCCTFYLASRHLSSSDLSATAYAFCRCPFFNVFLMICGPQMERGSQISHQISIKSRALLQYAHSLPIEACRHMMQLSCRPMMQLSCPSTCQAASIEWAQQARTLWLEDWLLEREQ